MAGRLRSLIFAFLLSGTVMAAPVAARAAGQEGIGSARSVVAGTADALPRFHAPVEIPGAPIYSAPAVSSRGGGVLDLFARGREGQVMWKSSSNGVWPSAWQDLGGDIQTSGLAAVSWGPGRIDVFAVSSYSNTLVHRYFQSGSWYPANWENLGGDIRSAPAVSSWGYGRLDVFAINSAGHVAHRYFDQSWYAGWEDLGGQGSGVAAVSWGYGRIDLVTDASGATLSHAYYPDNRGIFSVWENWGGYSVYGPPAITSWGPQRLDAFILDYGDSIAHRWWDGTYGTAGWENIGGTTNGQRPAAVSTGIDRLDVFYRDRSNALQDIQFA